MVLGRIDRLPAMIAAFGLLFFASSIQAQKTNPEKGDDTPPAEANGSASATVSASTSTGGEWGASEQGATGAAETPQEPQAAPSSFSSEAAPSGGSDHEAMVGNLGFGYFGMSSVPIGSFDQPQRNTIPAWTLGVRYWVSELVGIDAGLGLGLVSRSHDPDANGPAGDGTDFGFTLHGGVPLALAYSQHFVLELIPEINFGVGTGDYKDQQNNNIDLSGILFEFGGRVGGEIHFGFIDIPQLALQGTLGLHFRYESRTVSVGNADATREVIRFGTPVGNHPWEFFSTSIGIVYYIP
jgi:hypothetical protein